MERNILGPRLRERRRQVGVTQAALAKSVGISPSYLNLIEHNKRRVAGALLGRIAGELDMPLDELDGSSEQRLADALLEVAGAPRLGSLDIETDAIGALIGRFPGWARAIATLARAEEQAIVRARALGDRLSHDAFLGETVHDMRSRIAAVRAAAEILAEDEALPAERDRSFRSLIHDEAKTLSGVSEALAAYFDRLYEDERSSAPVDEVEALFETHGNRFDGIEAAAEGLASTIEPGAFPDRLAAAQACAASNLSEAIDGALAALPHTAADATRKRAAAAILAYAAAALLAPMSRFADAAREAGYDLEALIAQFGVDAEIVCKRLTALPTAKGRPRFGYYRANAAGALLELIPLQGLTTARYAEACPLWSLYRAQQAPGVAMRQRAVFPNGDRYVFVAFARPAGPISFQAARHFVTDMLAMREADAALTVYATEAFVAAENVGPGCRICPRAECAHRVEDALSA